MADSDPLSGAGAPFPFDGRARFRAPGKGEGAAGADAVDSVDFGMDGPVRPGPRPRDPFSFAVPAERFAFPLGRPVDFVPSFFFSRVGHSGLMQSVHGGRPASIAVTTGARQTGHGGWSFSSFPRWGRG